MTNVFSEIKDGGVRHFAFCQLCIFNVIDSMAAAILKSTLPVEPPS